MTNWQPNIDQRGGTLAEIAEMLSAISLDPADQSPAINALANRLKVEARMLATPGDQGERIRVTRRLADVLARHQTLTGPVAGYVRYPAEYTAHRPAWSLAEELADAVLSSDATSGK